jgi:hypothetical protein
LHTLCTDHNIKLASQWIPREQNKIAENLSIYSDCDDWGIHSDVFEELDALCGPHTVDRFATYYNSKCIRFKKSDPKSYHRKLQWTFGKHTIVTSTCDN